MDAQKRKLQRDEWHRKSVESLRLSFETTQLGYKWMMQSLITRVQLKREMKECVVKEVYVEEGRKWKLWMKCKVASLRAEEYMKRSRVYQKRSDEMEKLIVFSLDGSNLTLRMRPVPQ